MRDVEAIADIVVTTMKAAMAPVLERLAAAEARLGALTDVRDRLIVVETKAAAPLLTMDTTPVDLSPLTERLAVAEKMLSGLIALPERVAVMETKAAIPPVTLPEIAPVDLSPVMDRIKAIEQLSAAEASREREAMTALHERMAVVETKAAIPGPPGPAGKDGENGKDGQDGIAIDNMWMDQENERTCVLRARSGQQTKDLGKWTAPVDLYRGVWVEGKFYDCGDGVTWGGSEWHCNDTTTSKPGEGSKAWTLKVKRGRDGKDGRDAVALPVVKVG